MEPEERRLPSASTGVESKQDRKAVATKRPSIWNPFRRLETESDALEAAKAGAVVAGIIAIEHVVFGLSVGAKSATAGNLIAIVVMAFLGWSIFKEQKVWASMTLLVWAIVEIVAKIGFVLGSIAAGRGQPGRVFISFVVLTGALLSVRGCRKLQKLRQAEKL
jgi:hypothetical protein